MKYIALTFVFVALFLCSCNSNKVNGTQSSDVHTEDTLRIITEDMAFEGVGNYCHSAYDWSVAKDNPDIMYLTMGEETDSTYQVVFRSYTGAFVHFYVDKTTGTTRMVEIVPSLNVEEDAGTIDLFDYLKSDSIKISIERQLKEYPESRVLDIYKCFCQDNLGPGHLIPNKETARKYLMWELSAYRQDLDSAKYKKPALRCFSVGDEGNYVRVDLSVVLDSLMSADDYLEAFVRSANEGVQRSPEEWKRKWAEIASCIEEFFSDIPDAAHDLAFIDSIMAGDDLIIHHSEAFSNAYHPHYRIISKSIFESEIQSMIDLIIE